MGYLNRLEDVKAMLLVQSISAAATMGHWDPLGTGCPGTMTRPLELVPSQLEWDLRLLEVSCGGGPTRFLSRGETRTVWLKDMETKSPGKNHMNHYRIL